jgi:hypothetical protein
MKSIAFEFKCRRCGQIDRNPHTAEANGMMCLIAVIHGHKSPLTGESLDMVGVHTCPDEGMGVTDLIGYSIEK